MSVRQPDLIPLDVQNHTVKNIFGPDLYFSQFSFFHVKTSLFLNLERFILPYALSSRKVRNLVLCPPAV